MMNEILIKFIYYFNLSSWNFVEEVLVKEIEFEVYMQYRATTSY